MVDNKLGMPQLPSVVPPAEETFQSMDYGDMWAEAQMASVCRYLRAGVHLNLPESWRNLMPVKL